MYVCTAVDDVELILGLRRGKEGEGGGGVIGVGVGVIGMWVRF